MTCRARLAALALVLLAASARADPAITSVTAALAPSGPRAGVLRVEARIAAGWHVNSHEPSEDYLIPTELHCADSPGLRCSEPRYPPGVNRKFSFAEKPLSVYEGRFTIEVPVTWEGATPPSVAGTLEYQACNDRQCNPPATAAFRVGGASAASSAASLLVPPPLAGGAVPLSEAPAGGAGPGGRTPGSSNDFADLLERRGFAVVLLLLFAGGLALNLTPCVYPVIPLTVGFFAGQSQGGRSGVFRLASIYVLGMATMYSALGVAAALSGRLFGAALQSPWVLGGVALVLVALSLSLFGLYDLRMPRFLMQRAGARTGAAGAYGMGLLVGVVAAPCVGPFVVGLLAFVAARQNAALGFLFFFVLSLGLGLPYLLLGAFSGSLARLPRAGQWMESVKSIFGWVLLAMAAYFLRTALPEPVGRWILPVVLLIAAAALVWNRKLRVPLRAAVALVFLAAAVVFAPRRGDAASQPPWTVYSDAAVASSGRPAVLDFSAAWCAPCRELDEKTFSDPRVREALSRRALFQADMTSARAPEVVRLAERYRILGVPTIVFLDRTGREREELRLVGFEDPDSFLARLARAP